MTGFPLIIAFVIAIILMIVAISKFKIHPFISIMTVSLLLGLVAGIPLVNQTADDGTVTLGLANASSVSDWTTGQAAFLLNRKTVIKTSGDKVTETVEEHTDDGVWRQTLGTDAYPNFSGKVVIGREQLHTATPSVRCMSYTAKNKEP